MSDDVKAGDYQAVRELGTYVKRRKGEKKFGNATRDKTKSHRPGVTRSKHGSAPHNSRH